MPLHLIDSSWWTVILRREDNAFVRETLLPLIADDQAAWCEVIRLELWRGARSNRDRQELHRMERDLNRLPIDQATWDTACHLADICRKEGKPLPPTDLLIFSCAHRHGAKLLHRDKHFETLAELSLQL